MKKNLFWILFACGLVMTSLVACSSDDDEPTGIDDITYLQKRIAAEGSKVYGVQWYKENKDILNRPVETVADAQAEFFKLLSGGTNHKNLTYAKDGSITCLLTAADGKSQGSITYRPSNDETIYYCAEVTFSTEVKSATGVSCLRYILIDRWPEDGNGKGFVKDILDAIKK